MATISRSGGNNIFPRCSGALEGMGRMPVVQGKISLLSEKAQRMGLVTREDVEKEFVAAKSGWSRGTEYHCPFCDKDFWSPSGARKHMKTREHPVLRWDWY
jgi:hypothetical protein